MDTVYELGDRQRMCELWCKTEVTVRDPRGGAATSSHKNDQVDGEYRV